MNTVLTPLFGGRRTRLTIADVLLHLAKIRFRRVAVIDT
ncbi:hypothetical protein AGR3A_Cc420228 [Agrobacterium tomkonis CFBP 6623]|uniref:Uncharacterized protein n=1 Tax=Agrobacterium tomkonis CFBP 6623 TaxID=1183432 RepID=A0A1S7QCB7_9HYPH|nr:hypothetical protein AGR3A_Cc420228 [Agrobacterium tomkonis CFBP 6623]